MSVPTVPDCSVPAGPDSVSEAGPSGAYAEIFAKAVAVSPAAVAITDEKGILEFVNARYCEISGYTAEELKGRPASLLKSGLTDPACYASLRNTLAAGGDWTGVFHNRRKDGELYWESALISPVRDAAGRVRNYLKISEDITGRKELERAAAEAFKATAESQKRVEELERLALTDDLTGLFNRRGFEQEMQCVWALAMLRREPVGLLVIDIDHFKGVNDLHGHPIGDRALREVALLLQRELPAPDLLCRWGGDEMVAALPFTGWHETRRAAEKILQSVRAKAFFSEVPGLHLAVSIGAACTTVMPGTAPETLLRDADHAMFRAKQEGRDRVCFAEDGQSTAPNGGGQKSPPTGRGRILFVNDEPAAGHAVSRLFQSNGYEITLLSSSDEVRQQLKLQPGHFDVLLVDLNLGKEGGLDLLQRVRKEDDSIVGIVITGTSTMENALDALRVGAFDFLSKPLDLDYVIAALDRAMDHRRLLIENRRYQAGLEKLVHEKSAALANALERVRSTFLFTLEALAATIDAREKHTGDHSKRVSIMAQIVARAMHASEQQVEIIRHGGLLHDIGKIAIPDAILFKGGALSPEEWAIVRTHPDVGYNILNSNPDWERVAGIVWSHQERYDGKGYPRGLAGEDICLGARIFSVTDAYDAIRVGRPYAGARSPEEAMREIRANSGSQFDPSVVEALGRCQAEIEEVIVSAGSLVSAGTFFSRWFGAS